MKEADGNLYRAQTALCFLSWIASTYDDAKANPPPEDFGYRLSVILEHIEGLVREAYEEMFPAK